MEEPFDQEQPAPEVTAQFVLDRFVRIVEAHGGRELPDRCVGTELPTLTLPSDPAMTTTCGCGGQTRFELPYEREDGSVGTVTACAACDLGIRWSALRPPMTEGWL